MSELEENTGSGNNLSHIYLDSQDLSLSESNNNFKLNEKENRALIQND